MLSSSLAGGRYLLSVQFQVKIHDLPGAGGVNGRGSSALKFLTTHQLKVRLCGMSLYLLLLLIAAEREW